MKPPLRTLLTILFLLVVLSLISPANGATIRVPADERTIQAAINAAKSGDTVLVTAGIYRERIQMKNGVTLKSAGDDSIGKLGLARAEATIIDGADADGDGAGITMANDSIVDGFTVTGVGSYDETKWNYHHATHGNQQSHEHIGQPGTPGISVLGVTCIIRNNIVHHIGYTGIAIQSAEDKPCSPHIYRNTCYRNMGGGIGSMQKSTAVIEENTCFENFYAGIGHDNASPTVIKNICYRNIRAGIGISHDACPIVLGNKCHDNRRAGIGIRTGTDTRPIIEDNDCYQNQMAGIGSEEAAAPLIRNNRCYQNKLAGIGSSTGATPTIIGNECFQNEQVGIGQESDAVTALINNHCHHNKAAGIGFESCTAGRSQVINNRVIDNALVAIGIKSGWTVHLSGNELSREGEMPPIVMIFEGATATLVDNVIRGSGVAGIRVAGTVDVVQNEFIGTSMRPAGAPNFAIWALPKAVATVHANKIQGWRHGLFATEASITAVNNQISDFHGSALVISSSPVPANIYGNIAITKNPDAKVVSGTGPSDLIRNNTLSPNPKKP